MEGSPIIAGILSVCLVLALWGADSLLKRRFGQRDIGFVGTIVMFPTILVLIWLASHFVSTRSYYWFIAVGAFCGISSLISKHLFGKPRRADGEKRS